MRCAGAGGVFDSIERHITDQIPGKPTAIVQAMPGAGPIKVAELASRLAPKDGTAIVGLFAGAIRQPLLQPERTRFDLRQLNWLGSADLGSRMCVTFQHSKAKIVEDLAANQIIMGATAEGGSTWYYAWALKKFGGADLQIVAGYRGIPDLTLAMERGEIGMCGYSTAALRSDKPDWFRDKKLNFLVQFVHADDRESDKLGAAPIWKLVSGDRS